MYAQIFCSTFVLSYMEKKDLRIVFMGTPEFAVGTLQRLVEGGYRVVAVVTQPDKPVGRHQDKLQASAVKEYALAHQLPVLQPIKMKDPEFVRALAAFHADLQVVVAFRMLPEVVWSMPRLGTFNVHAALLPQYRGAAPINWAVINGETMTGVTTFFLDHHIDTGRIIRQKTFPIPDDADVEYVYNGLMVLGADLAIETVDAILQGDGNVPSMSQSEVWHHLEEASGCNVELKGAPKIFKETCEIDWQQPVERVYHFIRGLSPVPGAWTTLVPINMSTDSIQGKILKIYRSSRSDVFEETSPRPVPGTVRTVGKCLQVACTDGWLQLEEVQLSGKKRMSATDFLNGNQAVVTMRAMRQER